MDYGHEQTDKMLKNLEKRIQKEYSQAAREVEKSMNKWLADYQKNDDKMRALLQSGEISKKEYTDWRKKQILLSDKWKAQRDELTQVMMDADKVASGLITDHKMDVYALNYNYGTYEAEKGTRIDTGFSLYNKDTVARLMKDDPQLLPPPGEKTSEKIRRGELKKWNNRQVQSVMTQGILQGESIPKIAKRLAVAVAEKNAYSHYRAARTMTTSAENAGRMDSYKRAEGMGIKMGKTWLAAHDSRTRSSHREYDGMTIPLDDEFAKGLKFPGDPDAAPAEIYNCRCTLIANVMSINGIDVSHIGSRPWKDNWNINYEEWKHGRSENVAPQATTKQNEFVKLKSSDTDDSNYKGILETLEKRVDYNQVKRLSSNESPEQIISALSGGDKTAGSCASLGLCYIGRKNGYDVLDFRGGSSQGFFSNNFNLVTLSRAKGIKRLSAEGKSPLTVGNRLLKQCEEGKEYYLVCGRHASIVRRLNNELEYLELQSATKSGWTKFDGNPRSTLSSRFGCPSQSGYFASETNFMIDLQESDFDTDEFRTLLGYMNTSEGNQKKGKHGTIK